MNRKDRRAAGKRPLRDAKDRTDGRRRRRAGAVRARGARSTRPGSCSRPSASTARCWRSIATISAACITSASSRCSGGSRRPPSRRSAGRIAVDRSRSRLPLQHGVRPAARSAAVDEAAAPLPGGDQAQARLCRGAHQSRQRAGRARQPGRCRRRLRARDRAQAERARRTTISPMRSAQLGRMDEAENQYRRALALKPDLAGAHNNLANALVAQGRADEALIHFQRALELAPDLVEAHVNLGTTLLQQGKLAAAAAQLERAVSIDPISPTPIAISATCIWRKAGSTRRRSAISVRSRSSPIWPPPTTIWGSWLRRRAATRRRAAASRARWRVKPDFIDAYNNLGRAFMALGQPDHALGALRRALDVAETADTKSLFVQCVKMLAMPPASKTSARCCCGRCRSRGGAPASWRGSPRARSSRTPRSPLCMARALGGMAAPAGGRRAGRSAARWPRFRAIGCCAACWNPPASRDLELERFLTALRFALLELVSAPRRCLPTRAAGSVLRARPAMLPQRAGVRPYRGRARRCAAPARRWWSRRSLRGRRSRSRGSRWSPAIFRCIRCPGRSGCWTGSWSAATTALLVQQVREPAQERELSASIPALTAIDDAVSRKVQRQYEENPYPRWAKADPPGAAAAARSVSAPAISRGELRAARQDRHRHPDCRLRHRTARDRDRPAVRRRKSARRRSEPGAASPLPCARRARSRGTKSNTARPTFSRSARSGAAST